MGNNNIFGFINTLRERRFSDLFMRGLKKQEKTSSPMVIECNQNASNDIHNNKGDGNKMSSSIRFYFPLDDYLRYNNKDNDENEKDIFKSERELPEIFRDGNFVL